MLPLILSDVSVRRKGKTLLGPLDLRLEGAGLTAVIGPNGSGKTTLLRVMHGIERLSTGSAHWAIPTEAARGKQAYVFQTPILLRRSVDGNLRYPLRLAHVADSDARVTDWATRIGLADRRALPAQRLSGGERQKLALARALITDPQVLFLDEPCANLDGAATRDIEALLAEAVARGTRIVLATHDMGQARRLATDAIFVKQGLIHEQGSTILTAPQSSALKSFLNGDIVT